MNEHFDGWKITLQSFLQLADILVDGKIGPVDGYPRRFDTSALGDPVKFLQAAAD
jgi:hypothetical protein